MDSLSLVFDGMAFAFMYNAAFGICISAFLGLITASFAGVVIGRLPTQLGWIETDRDDISISYPASQCDACERPLSILELIPVVGWLATKGKCKSCSCSVPWIYPASEFAMALLFVLSWFIFNDVSSIVSAWLILVTGYIIACLDLEHHWIPAVITTPMMWVGLLVSPFEPEMHLRVYGAAAGGVIMLTSFYVVHFATKKDTYSGGDIAFAIMVGAWVGIGYMSTFLIIAAGLFFAHALREFTRGVRWVPFGPALVVGFLATLLIIEWF